MNKELNNQSGAKESSAVLTSAERNAAENEALTHELRVLCEDCEESSWNDCNRCIAKLDRMVEGMNDKIKQLEQENKSQQNAIDRATGKLAEYCEKNGYIYNQPNVNNLEEDYNVVYCYDDDRNVLWEYDIENDELTFTNELNLLT